MAYKKVEDFVKLPTVRLDRDGEGTESEFKLLETKTVQSKQYPDKQNHVYTAEYNGEDLNKLIAEFKAEFPDFEKDHKFQFWGAPILDRKLGQGELGSQIKVVYLGKIPHQRKGYNPLANFDVYFDDGSEGSDESKNTSAAGKKTDVPF
jgi:hypothetical protein